MDDPLHGATDSSLLEASRLKGQRMLWALDEAGECVPWAKGHGLEMQTHSIIRGIFRN